MDVTEKIINTYIKQEMNIRIPTKRGLFPCQTSVFDRT